MSIAQNIFCFFVPLTMLFADVLSVVTGVGGCWCPISDKSVRLEVTFCQFSDKPPNSDSVDSAITSLMMLHYTCTGLLYRGISCTGVLDFGTRKKSPPDLLRASGSDMWDTSE